MTGPVPQPGILDIQAYVGGGHEAPGVERVIVLSANETPLGPSPSAVDAYQALSTSLHRYPDGDSAELRQAIAKRHSCAAERIVCGNGSDELISLLVRCYAGVGDEVLYSRHGFMMYPISAQTVGATPIAAPEANYTVDVDAMLAQVTSRTRIAFVANPNNPTGSYISSDEMRRLREGLPDNVLLVIDAAYAEYVTRNDYTAGSELVEEYDNVVMTRTFSKIFGLAALRLGWAYCSPQIADVLNRVRGPFNVTAAAQSAGVAALADIGHTDAALAHNDVWLPWLTGKLNDLGLTVHPSVGNFVLVRFEDTQAANAAYSALMKAGIIARQMGGYGLPECIRITIGLEEENELVVQTLEAYLTG